MGMGAVMLQKFINRFLRFQPIGGAWKYLHRWTLFRTPSWFPVDWRLYLHHFVGDDWSRDMHDHPKRFISIGLKGRYIEHTPNVLPVEYRAPWIRSFPALHTHRLTLSPKCRSCWTLVLVLTPIRDWGFHTRDGWVQWERYVSEKMTEGET